MIGFIIYSVLAFIKICLNCDNMLCLYDDTFKREKGIKIHDYGLDWGYI